MLIDLNNSFIFHHLFKTGGTSVTRMLQTLSKNTCDILYDGANASKNVLLVNTGGHYSITEFSKIYPEFDYSKYFTFTFVRNPWDRTVSMYKHEQQSSYFDNYADDIRIEKAKELTFDRYIKSNTWKEKAVQFDQLTLNGKLIPNYIGRFENLANDLRTALSHLNITISDSALDIRINTHNEHTYILPEMYEKVDWHYSQWYNDEQVEHVRNITKKDIEYFNYTFDDKR